MNSKMKEPVTGLFLGADGCKDGWIVAAIDNEMLRLEKYRNINCIIEKYPEFDAFLIDMVIGLPDNDRQKRPDKFARKELNPRGSTVFSVPSRAAVKEKTYDRQKAANFRSLGKSLSKQSSAIIPKIREIDGFMSAHPEYRNRIDESHPELDFARLNGSVLLSRKKEKIGIEDRVGIIRKFLPGTMVPDLYDKAKELKCNADDLADAICLAVTARLKTQGLCETIPDQPEKDSNGLYMKLTVPLKDAKSNMKPACVRYEFLSRENVDLYIDYLRSAMKLEPEMMTAESADESGIRERVNSQFFMNTKSILALIGGQAIGRIEYHFYGCLQDGTRMAYVDWVYVLPGHRHMGVAQGLFREFEQQCSENHIDQYYLIRSEKPEADRFYHSFCDAELSETPLLRKYMSTDAL